MSDSIWKKEISFGRRKERGAEPAPDEQPKQSVWKKELSLGRKKERTAPADEQAQQRQSIWKREVALGRKKKDDEAVARLVELATRTVAPDFDPTAAPPPPPQPVLVPAPAPASAPVDHPVDLHPVDLHPVEVLPVDEPVVAPVAPVAPIPPVAPVPPAIVDVSVPPPAPVPAPVPAEQPLHVEQGPVEAWMEPAPAEPWLSEQELPPAPEEPTAVVVHPPVPAAELPPLAEARTPFWKKELSLGRRPKQPKTPSQARTPFWKKELSFARRQTEGAPKTPFWKKELSFSRSRKAAPEPEAPAAPKQPRRLSLPSLSLPSLSLPTRSRGGGKGGRHQVKRLVGLKVGGSQLAAARIANNGAAELLQVARADLDPGVVVSGELRDLDSLAEALKSFFAAHKLPRKNVRLGIASNRIGVRIFDIGGIDDPKQLENAIHFRAQEALPIPLDEAVLDYHVLEERTDDEGNATKRVLLVVAYRELVDRYVAACKKAGITLAGIDLEAFALLRALAAPRPEDQPGDSALVAVAIGHDRSTFAVSDGRVCEFTRVLEWGGAALNVAIARALDLAPSEVEGIKRVVSLSSTEVPEGVAPEAYAHALDAVRKQVQAFARELVSSLQFYQNQPGSLGIGEIVITGGSAHLVGLADELQRLIGVRVRVGDPLARLKVTKKVALDEQVGSLAVAIGLGIED
jgi:type IV pilus assembly protein PilM